MRGGARRPRSQASRRAQLWAAARAVFVLALLAAVGRVVRGAYARWSRVGAFTFPPSALPPPPRPQPGRGAPPAQRRIPRLVHQTLPAGGAAPRRAGAAAALASWTAFNPGWVVKRYDDAAASAFVAAEFPEHAAAYAALPAAVQRADLFRVLVLLRSGGVYADADAACVAPLDGVLQAEDTLVVGWENAFASAEQAQARHYVRQRQVLNWVFAAAPGHPALRDAAAAIVAAASAPLPPGGDGGARAANAAVLERTGPGVWTDALLAWYARAAGGGAGGRAQAARVGSASFGLRLLPRVAFGTHPRPGSADGVPQRAPEVVVAHAFAGGWKRKDGVQALPWPLRPLLRPLARAATAALPGRAGRDAARAALVRQRAPFYPVSAAWTPPFDVLLPPPPSAAETASSAVAAAAHLLAWGVPSPRASPSPAEVLLAPLLRGGEAGAARGMLLDVGSAHGFYALAAVASGASAAAFEPHPELRGVLERARGANSFGADALRLHNALLGDGSAAFCAAWRRLGGARGAGLRHGRAVPEAALLLPHLECSLPKGHATLDDVARNAREQLAAAGGDASGPLALRVAVGGWEGFVLDGGAVLLGGSAPPATVLIELHPRRLQRSGWGDPPAMLERLRQWGYTSAAHAGPACDAARRRAPDEPQPSGWCALTREAAARLAKNVPLGQTEALLFMRA